MKSLLRVIENDYINQFCIKTKSATVCRELKLPLLTTGPGLWVQNRSLEVFPSFIIRNFARPLAHYRLPTCSKYM